MGKLFGTDGIRGVANEKLTPEMVLRMGRIVASLLAEGCGSSRPFFLLGRDTRISGAMLEGALSAGIASAGVDVRLLGVVSTPAVAYLVRRLKAAGGVMISASHNPVEDNGIKFFNAEGRKLDDALEARAEKLYFGGGDSIPLPTGIAVGRVINSARAVHHYTAFLEEGAPQLEGFRVALDCANGSLSRIAPRLYRKLGAELIALHSSPNGANINVRCGSTNPAFLQEAVRQSGAQAGLAFDGDGDRLIAVDENGDIVDGDAIMAICGDYLRESGQLHGGTIVATVMSNGGLELTCRERGIKLLRTRVGDRYVLEEMIKGGYALGGEQSGHIIFYDYIPTGDGLFTSLQLLKVMAEKGASLSTLAGILQRMPQVLVNCRLRKRDGWEQNSRIRESLRLAEEKLGTSGRVLVRASGTEPLIRIMVEGEDSSMLQEISQELAATFEMEMGRA